jgi:2'-5' RNA ligase
MSDTIRSYISIELPADVRAALAALQNRLKRTAPPQTVRWSGPDNMHLTLHFLGEVTPADFVKLDRALKAKPLPYLPFSLTISELGCFPNLRRPRVVWVGIQGNTPALLKLHQEVERLLKETIGFKPEARPYSPHLTLGRVKPISASQLAELSQALQQAQSKVGQVATLEVTEIHLMMSKLNQGRNIDLPG